LDRETLVAQLTAASIPLDQWGTGKAKTVDHLLEEVNGGETVLSCNQDGLLREVSVAAITVTCSIGEKNLILREDRQVFGDGRVRRRKLETTMGEKMQPGESPIDAARRSIREELGIQDDKLRVIDGGFLARGPEESPSYPGLRSLYRFFRFSVDLPVKHYRREGYTEEQGDKTTYFVWE
jgi:hypothetical protein